MKQCQCLHGLAGLRESAYDGVPRAEFPVRVFVEHPAGGAQVASLRVAADERALGERVAREAALDGGGVKLQAQAGPGGLGLGRGLEGERERVVVERGAVGQHARGGAESGAGRAEVEVGAGEGVPVEGQQEEAAAQEARVDPRREAPVGAGLEPGRGEVGGVVVRREGIAIRGGGVSGGHTGESVRRDGSGTISVFEFWRKDL